MALGHPPSPRKFFHFFLLKRMGRELTFAKCLLCVQQTLCWTCYKARSESLLSLFQSQLLRGAITGWPHPLSQLQVTIPSSLPLNPKGLSPQPVFALPKGRGLLLILILYSQSLIMVSAGQQVLNKIWRVSKSCTRNLCHTWFFGMLFLNKFFLFLLKISYNCLSKNNIKSQITLKSLLLGKNYI